VIHIKRSILIAAVVLVLPSVARADWLFTPYIGGNFAGDSADTQTNFGISAAWMGAGIFGFEFDAGFAPDFFDSGVDDDFALISNSSVSTYMFNAIIGVPVGGQQGMGVRPYGSIGIGAIRSDVESDLGLVDATNTDFGWNIGAGAIGFFSDAVGARGDVRYFRSLQNELEDGPIADNIDRFGFWRLTGGVVFRWGAMP
jgi:opacity protein-like surface antigen